MYVLSDLDRLCIVAKQCYGDSGAVLATPTERGELQPEIAEVRHTSYDQQSSGSTRVLH